MLVWESVTDAKTGETARRQVERDVVTAAQQAPIDAANAAVAQTASSNGLTLEQQAVQALAGNKTYLARATPTTAQKDAQLRLVTQECTALIRLLLKKLEATD